MTTAAALALYPNYAVSPSPYPRPAYRDLTLIAVNSAEQFSGLFTKAIALIWGFRRLASDAEILAVELITRAVETTGDPNPHRTLIELSRKRIPNIGIRVTRRERGVLIEVWDSDSNPPHDADPHLSTVAKVSQEWGCYRPRGGGKVIWAELDLPHPRRAEPAEPMPQRTAGYYSYPEPDEPVTPLQDLRFMRKVRDGLHHLDTDGGHRGRL